MAGRTVSRRFVVGVLGSSAAAASLLTRAASAAPRAASTLDRAEALVAPLAEGARLDRWTIARVEPLHRGAVTLTLAGADGRAFRLEILARDASPLAPRPPAVTERFAVHVCNGGDGWLPTVEEQGLAAMALARAIAVNEQAVEVTGFLTHAERLTHHRASLLSGSPPARS
jgi:hypothetical protein